MAETISISQGQSVASIAYKNGFLENYLWNLSENAELKALRKDPNILQPGDQVYVPDKRDTPVSKPSDQQHKFRRKGVPIKLHLRLLNNDIPRKQLKYRMVIDGTIIREGQTDGDGRIVESIAPDARKAVMTLLPVDQPSETYTLQLSCLDPIDTAAGVQARLANLGLFTDAQTGKFDEPTATALRGFQKSNDLPISGKLDDATRSKLSAVHGS